MDGAIRLLDAMVSVGLKPDAVACNTLINGFCRNRMIQEGLILSRIMLSEGAKPGVISYSIMLQGIFADWDGCFCNDYQWNMLGVITSA
jgi:leucine-rich PPR motif-containing protein